jgi:hypothetical protein
MIRREAVGIDAAVRALVQIEHRPPKIPHPSNALVITMKGRSATPARPNAADIRKALAMLSRNRRTKPIAARAAAKGTLVPMSAPKIGPIASTENKGTGGLYFGFKVGAAAHITTPVARNARSQPAMKHLTTQEVALC